MFKFFRKHRTVVLVSLVICAIALPFLQIGSSSLLPSANDVVVKVNGRKVTQGQFDKLYNQAVRQRPASTPEQKQQVMREVLDELVRREVFAQEADKYGISVSDQEMQLQLASIPAFQKEGRFDPQTYMQVVYQSFGTTPKEFEKGFRKELQARKLNQLIGGSVFITDEAFAAAPPPPAPKDKKDKPMTPESYREELRSKELNLVYRDWLNYLNSNLKVNIVSDRFRDRMAGKA
jgi:peptidyl-prolyl cis-trans isomerase D